MALRAVTNTSYHQEIQHSRWDFTTAFWHDDAVWRTQLNSAVQYTRLPTQYNAARWDFTATTVTEHSLEDHQALRDLRRCHYGPEAEYVPSRLPLCGCKDHPVVSPPSVWWMSWRCSNRSPTATNLAANHFATPNTHSCTQIVKLTENEFLVKLQNLTGCQFSVAVTRSGWWTRHPGLLSLSTPSAVRLEWAPGKS